MEDTHGNHPIEWDGYYVQNGQKHPVVFQDMKLTSDGHIVGGGLDGVGNFGIKGMLKGSDVEFDKEYVGKHSVKYTGKLNQGVISGKWSVAGSSDEFQIKMKTKQWKGSFTHHGVVYEMVVSLDISNEKDKRAPVKGLGGDSNGNYCIEGFKPIMGGGNTILFTKKYFGQSIPVNYAGTIGTFGGEEKISGYWTLGIEAGEFQLTKQA